MKSRIVSLFIFCLIGLESFAVTRFVSPTGSGTGTSWADAAPGTQLQAIINASTSGDEVWVMAGLYVPGNGTSRDSSFHMRNGVAVYGSFEGTETEIAQRSFANGITSILSGERGNLSLVTDNCFDVVRNGSGLTATAILDGFVVRDGFDNRAYAPATPTNGLGGGIYNGGVGAGTFCNPTIRNCVITANTANFGAGIFNDGSSNRTCNPTILNCIIVSNNALMGGGGIDNFGAGGGNASPTITNTIIALNTAASRAGGMYCWGGSFGNSSPVVLNSIFYGNIALANNLDPREGGGGVVADRLNFTPNDSSGTSNPTFRNTVFWQNFSPDPGPQFLILGGATFTATYSDIDLTGQTAPHVISGPGTGNLNTDPMFVDPGNGAGADGDWLTADDGFMLLPLSPCIDAGDNVGLPNGDIRSYWRISGPAADIGAYESNSSALPIDEWISFVGEALDETNLLSWAVTFSGLTPQFEIERSDDGLSFERIGAAASGKMTQQYLSYQFTDGTPILPLHYYRLKSESQNGEIAYSAILSLYNGQIGGYTVYPNPSDGHLNIKGGGTETLSAEIISPSGVIVKSLNALGNTLDISDLPDGVYVLRFKQGGDRLSTQRVVKN